MHACFSIMETILKQGLCSICKCIEDGANAWLTGEMKKTYVQKGCMHVVAATAWFSTFRGGAEDVPHPQQQRRRRARIESGLPSLSSLLSDIHQRVGDEMMLLAVCVKSIQVANCVTSLHRQSVRLTIQPLPP